MGIFKDLGFKNRNDKISAPSAERFAGYTLDEVKAQINPTFVQIDGSIDGQAIIDGASLPTTIIQDTDWSSIQPVAYGFKSVNEDIGSSIKTIYSSQPGASDWFGASCAIGSTFMLIGSHSDDDKATDAGKVEMFDLNGNYIKTIYSNKPAKYDRFGYSCAIGSTCMLIGTNADKVEMFDLNGNYIKTIYGSQPRAGDRFGTSCAIGSTFMLIGSQDDGDKGIQAGKVEMFDLNGNYIKTIYSKQPAPNDFFGISCAIGSTFMLIGSHSDDDKGSNAGKVEMFDLNGTYIKTIYSNQPAANDLFGGSCAIGSTFMLIGSFYDGDKGAAAGKVEMFDLNGTYIKTIYSNQPAAYDYFGTSCAIGSTFMLIGSQLDGDKGPQAGKVEMFTNSSISIPRKLLINGYEQKIINDVTIPNTVPHVPMKHIKTIYSNQPGAGDQFGASCAIGSTFMLIGSQNDGDKGYQAGKVEMFDLNGNYIKTIYSNQPGANDGFGVSCAIGSTFMLIGSFYDADKGSYAGKVEMFDLNGNYIKTIYSNQPAAGDQFGRSCAIGSTFMLIGSSGDADKGGGAGKVEIFDLNGNYIKTIYSSQPGASDWFGASCVIGSTFMLIGSYTDDDKATDAGKVEMFDLNGNYIKTIYSNQPGANDGFGVSCAIGSTFMLIGSFYDTDKGSYAGKVEMFDLNGNYIKTIYSNQPGANDSFGRSCAIGSTFMLIGSSGDADKGTNAGKVEMFAINTTQTTFEKSVSNSNTLSIKNEGLIDSLEINFFE